MRVEKPHERTLKADPRDYPDYTEADVQALRALNRGEATTDQQRRAVEYLVNWVCCTYDMAYRPSERETLLQLGKQMVGQHVVWLLKTAETKAKGDGETS